MIQLSILKRKSAFFLLFTLLLAMLGGGCSSTSSTATGPSGIFQISQKQAEDVIAESIREGWPEKKLEPAKGVDVGFQFRVYWGIDHDTVVATAQKQSKGYSFSVTNHGTAPASGDPARKKLIDLILRNARKVEGQ